MTPYHYPLELQESFQKASQAPSYLLGTPITTHAPWELPALPLCSHQDDPCKGTEILGVFSHYCVPSRQSCAGHTVHAW